VPILRLSKFYQIKTKTALNNIHNSFIHFDIRCSVYELHIFTTMKFLILILSILTILSFAPTDFKSKQLKSTRVKKAYKLKGSMITELLKSKGIESNKLQLYIRAFKKEQKLEVWGKNSSDTKYLHLKTFDFCETSGELGPKRKQGDSQIPEGFYHIDRFNPWSNFHLSLGINYPNKSDKILGKQGKLGGDIFLHGNCVTIGCIPITDDKIQVLYILAIEAKNNGFNIPVTIFPAKLDESGLMELKREYEDSPELITFWKSLQPGYLQFEVKKQLPNIGFAANGSYLVN